MSSQDPDPKDPHLGRAKDDMSTGELWVKEAKETARRGLLTEIADGVVELSKRTKTLTTEIKSLKKRSILRGRVLLGFILISVLIFATGGALLYQEHRNQREMRQEICTAFDSVEVALVDLILLRDGRPVSPEEQAEREKFADQISQRFQENDPCG